MINSSFRFKKKNSSKFVITVLAAIALFFISVSAKAQAKCGFDEIYEKKMRTDPAFKARVDATNLEISQFIKKRPTPKKGAKIVNGSYVIPVVVHVLHTGGAEGTIYNPPTPQILGAINYLNQVYAGTHTSMFGGVGNMGLQFELAQRDPYCNPTNGINRINASSIPNYTSKGINAANADGATETAVKSFAKWNQTDYYNIWVVNKIDGADGTSGQYIAGYAYFPTNSTPTAVDGTVMLSTTFIAGNGTLPHEIGHAFALYHTFQGSANSSLCPINNNCSTDGDLVCDTDPVRHYINASGALNSTCRTGTNPCTNAPYNISTESNFMGYSDCNTLFTAGQKARVQAALSSPSRVGLTQSQAGTPCPSVTSATVAYSLRKLLSTYTGSAIQVRRSNDNAILNIGFLNGYLDTVALKAFVGSSSGFVTTWYDQSGNSRNATNTTLAQQPTIVSNGVITRLNGRVALYFGVSNLATAKATLFADGTTMVGVAKGNSTTPSTFVSKTGTSTGLNNNLPGPFDFTNTIYAFFTGNASTGVRREAYLNTISPRSDVSSSVAASVYSFTIPTAVNANAYNYINGTLASTIPIAAYADNGNSLMIGNRNDYASSGNLWTPEIVLFNGVINDALRRSLEAEQKSYYIDIPIITVQPSTSSPAAVCIGTATTALSVTATGGGTLAYQWYKNAANSTEGGIPISGATSSTCTPATTLPGVSYYYVGVTSSVTNSIIYSGVSGAITVNPNQPTGTISGTTSVCANATTTLTAPALPTGGTITTSGKYRIHTFTTSGLFTTPVGFSGSVEVLIVAGGGGGGGNGGGGGGAGAVQAGTLTLGSNVAYTITVGAGGAGSGSGSTLGTSGNNSAFANIVSSGGGGGASRDGGGAALAGGSGGGGGGVSGSNSIGASPGTSVAGQGNDGANGTPADLGCDAAGGGGGGASTAGTAAAAQMGGNGGNGIASSITGTILYYAAGGGGGRTCNNATLGIGGSVIGGNGGGSITAATSGAANTGSGGGGGGQSGTNGNGGSGIVVVRYVDYSTGTWSSSNTNVATVNASGVVTGVSAGTATITLQNSVCSGASSATVTVLASPVVTFTAQPSGSICTGTDVTYSTQAFQSNYTWSIPGVLNTNYSITSGSTSSNFVTLKWLIAGSRTVSVNYSNAIGCRAANAATSNALTVTTANTITLSSAVGTNAQSKNINTAITNITYNTVGATGATITGLPTGVTGIWASNVVTISGTPTAVGNYNYTVTLIGGCGTITQTGSISVIFVAPTIISPTITYTTPQAYTIGMAITPLAPTNTGGAVPATNFGQVTTFAGSGTNGSVDATGAAASFNNPYGIATDFAENIYVADQISHKIRKITSAGVVTTFAGNGTANIVNANTALAASFYYPTAVAINAAGDVYVAEPYANRIRKITALGVVTTFAGSGAAGAVDATGSAASFSTPIDLTVDASGNVYVVDQSNHKIRKITPAGVVTTLAGSGTDGAVDASTGAAASFSYPAGVALDAAGNVYVSDQNNHKIRKISTTGVVTTFAGSGTTGSSDGPGTSASFIYPNGLAIDAGGNLYVADGSNKIRKITPAGIVTTLAGSGTTGAIDAIGTSASFNNPTGVAVDALGNAYIPDRLNNKIRKISIAGYTISPALPAGLSFNPTTGIISGTPTVVSSATNYTIVAYNAGGSSTNTVSIATVSANNANLSGLTTTAGTLTPAFTAATTAYVANVTNTTTSLTVTPTKADATSTLQVRINNGIFATVASGTSSAALSLNVGSNTIDIKVTAQDGTTVKTYTITVTRACANTTSTTTISNCTNYTWNGVTYTTSGTYIKTGLVNAAGCDSVATLNLTITPSITPLVTIAANPGNSITTGTSVTFTATPTNGGITPVYQWKKNGNNVGTNSVTYTDAGLQNGDIITCVLTSNAPCASPVSATSTGITMAVSNPCASGTTWISRTAAANYSWRSVIYGNGIFVAVATDFTGNSVMTSPDGITWSSRATAANYAWYSVTYGNGLFVAVAQTGTGNSVMTSLDGITWTERTAAANNFWRSVTYGNGVFVAVSESGTGNRVMTSPDGITWTIRTSAADNPWVSVTYGNGLFVAVAYTGSVNSIMTSPDGITWTGRTPAANNAWYSVTYGNGVFVAIANNGSVNRVMTSPDGITWTSRTPAATNAWFSVTYGNGVFMAVSIDGTGNRVMSSPDGINWTSRTSAANNPWTSVTYANGVFVAVGYSGTGNGVMTSSGLVTPSVTIAANPGNSITTGTAVTFTATPTNGGTTPAYQWKKNGNNVGTNSVTYTDAALQNGDIITCVLTSNNPCASQATATSTGITITIINSSNANLSALTTTAGTLTPAFAAATTAYAANVTNTTTSVTVTPTKADANAIIQVRINAGSFATITSGTASAALSLNVGSNTIDIKLTAQDGTTIKTYTITVTRACANTSSTTTISNCGNYTWNGVTYTTSGTYTKTLVNAAGCDSVATLNLTVNINSIINTINNQTVCAGNSVLATSFSGTANGYTWTNNNTAIGLASNGTGNIAAFTATNTLNVPITATVTVMPIEQPIASYPLITDIKDATGSFGDIILRGNVIVPTVPSATNSLCVNGIYLFANGGQDVITPNITSLNPTNFSISVDFKATSFNTPVIIGGDMWRWIGIYTNAAGNIGLMWNGNSTSFSTKSLSLSQWYNVRLTFNNNTANLFLDGVLVHSVATGILNSTNNLNFTTTNFGNGATLNGCIRNLKIFNNPVCTVSTQSFTITVKAASTSITNTSICPNALPYTWNGIAYNAAGIYTKTLVNAAGCDSVATLNLTIKQPSTSTTTISNCTSYTWNGTTYTASGTYTRTLVNAAGCDSVATLNLTIKQPSTSTTTISNCTSFTWNGVTYTTSGTYTKTLTNAAGCDSVATLNLTIKQPTTSTTTISNCNNYIWNGTTYTVSGVYTKTLVNAAGCDSVATLNLTIKQPTTSTTTISNCSSYIWNGTTYTASGTYIKTLLNAAGCDSIATLNLTIKQATTSTATISNCSSYTWNSTTYTASGTYTKTLVNAAGCDSIATLNLTIKQATTSTTTISNCSGYTWNGVTYTASGTYIKTLVNVAGCDSVATLNLTIKQATTSTTTVSNCVSYTWNSTTYTASGTYTRTLVNAAGCDSVATLNLTIKLPTTSTTTISNCNSYTWNGVTYTVSGTYTKTLVNASGCDSIATLNLTIVQNQTPSVSITASSTSIAANTSVTFTAVPILGGSAPSYTFNINGTTMQTGSSNTFTTSFLVNGATVSCTMLSNATCLIASTANSNSISVSVSGIVILPLSGGTQNASAKIIPGITMRIRGDVTDSVTTDANGKYRYNFQALKNYTITPYKNNDVVKASGINVLDVLQTQSHILNNVLLNTPYRIIAADVNSDAKVNVIDVLLIKRLILGTDTTFSGNKLWAFVDSSQVFANPAMPFPFSNSRAFNNLSLPFTNQSFTGVKLGDVNQNWSPVVGVNGITPEKSVQLYYDTINTSDNSMLRLRVRAKGFKDVTGMQFALGFNAANLQLVSVENMGLAFDYNVLPASKGAVSFIWADANNVTNSLTDGTALFDVVLKKQSGVTNDTLSIHPNYTPAIAYGKNDEPMSVVMASKVIGNSGGTVTDNTVYVDQVLVTPNPSKGLIQLRVTARKSQQISINITDVLGRTILKKQIVVAVGANDMPLNLEVNRTIPSGIYYLKVQGLDKIFVKQILVQK